MEVTHHKLEIKRTAHYYSLGSLNEKTNQIWMILHGYGQQASRIIQKFNHLDLSDKYVFAPEGLNTFYWNDKERTPVSTWMTKRHRLDEIKDYKLWLDNCYEDVLSKLDQNVSFNLLGFSQGTATAWRWLLHKKPKIDKFVQWAGDHPPELDYVGEKEYIGNIEKLFVYGDQDKFIDDDRARTYAEFNNKNELDYDVIKFSGTHKIDRTVLAQIVDKQALIV